MQIERVNAEKQARSVKRESMTRFIATLDNQSGSLTEFNEELWYATVDMVTVSEKSAAFAFRHGTVVEVDV